MNFLVIEDANSALDVSLHPLTIINISDHFTREKVTKGENTRVFGALIGLQKGRKVEIFDSFAFLLKKENGNYVVDTEYLSTKIDQFKKVFEDYECLGWYATGDHIESYDQEVHVALAKFNESPLYLLLDPFPAINSRDMPLTLMEGQLKIQDDTTTYKFGKIPYKIETTDAERIAVDHVARAGSSNDEGSKLTAHLLSIRNAIKMLNMRIKLIVQFIEAQKSGELPVDYSLLRRINALCHLLPAIDGDNFKQEFLNEHNDTLLATYLASITKASNAINELVDKFNITYDRHSRRRGFF